MKNSVNFSEKGGIYTPEKEMSLEPLAAFLQSSYILIEHIL